MAKRITCQSYAALWMMAVPNSPLFFAGFTAGGCLFAGLCLTPSLALEFAPMLVHSAPPNRVASETASNLLHTNNLCPIEAHFPLLTTILRRPLQTKKQISNK